MSQHNNKIINPFTNRLAMVGGRTYKKVLKKLEHIDQKGGGIYENLVDKAKNMEVIPRNKFELIPSKLAPAPKSTEHSWYHHHAPFAQTFGDYVCLKKTSLKAMGSFLHDNLS